MPRRLPPETPAGFPAEPAVRVLHELTVRFCQRFLVPADGTADAMRQAAGAVRRQLAELARLGGAHPAAGLRLAQAARAHLGDLRADFADFLQTRYQSVWPPDGPEAAFIRQLALRPHGTSAPYRPYLEHLPAEAVANLALCLIREASQQLARQIAAWEQRPATPATRTQLLLRPPAAA